MLINMRSVAFSVSLLLTSSAADSYRYVNNLKQRRVIDKHLQTLEFLSNFNLVTISSQTCLANTKFEGWGEGGKAIILITNLHVRTILPGSEFSLS